MDVTTASAPSAVEISLYATWSMRVGAWLIDAALIVVAMTVVAAVSDSLGVAATLVLAPAYVTVCHGSRSGQTIGKRALGISVRDATSLGRIGYGRALVRWLVTFLFWSLLLVPGLLDALAPLWDRRRQAWHDKAVGTVVIRL
jgi:uncharacterized RDD family membrane protein YckC